MTVEMTHDEMSLVRQLIQRRIQELGPEIHHTHRHEYRDGLEHLREQLAALLIRMQPVAA